MKRVVITGTGAMTALGEGAEALWSAAREGRTGIDRIRFGENGTEISFPAAAIQNFSPEKFVTQRKALKVMARDIQLAVAAASLALDDALVKSAAVDRRRFGIIVGSGVLNHELDELAYSVLQSLGPDKRLDLKKFGTDGLPALFPLWLLKYLPNMSACHISIFFDLQGPNNTLTTGASAGLGAVAEAFRIIRRGSADLMLAGGAESRLNPLGLSQYRLMNVLSDDGYRPFDRASRGFIVGEGGGFVVLEELEHAKKRGARIYGEIIGAGTAASDAPALAMKTALAQSGIGARDVDYVQAAGIGLPQEDDREAEAIESVLGASTDLCVTASKPVTGFTGYSAGALDFILSSLAVSKQEVPPVREAASTACSRGFKLVKDFPAKKKIRHSVTHAFGLKSPSVCVVTKAGEPHA